MSLPFPRNEISTHLPHHYIYVPFDTLCSVKYYQQNKST